MSNFNPLDYPICFSYPLRIVPGVSVPHLPFAMTLVDLLRPRVIVELGTTDGVSYCAFCQAADTLKLDARCFAVGDSQNAEERGRFFDDWSPHHNALYGGFSELVQPPSDSVLSRIEDGAVDLLHLAGGASYAALRERFEKWLPKMSDQSAIVVQDVNFRRPEFGAWKLWQEIRPQYPHFEFLNGNGLGVVSIGASVPDPLRRLLATTGPEASLIREFFLQQGHRLEARLARHEILKDKLLESRETTINLLASQITNLNEVLEIEQAGHRALLGDKNEILQNYNALLNHYTALLSNYTALLQEFTSTSTRLNSILKSRAWRWVTRYGRLKRKVLSPLQRPLGFEEVEDPEDTTLRYSYDKWVRKYDALTDRDRADIMARIEWFHHQPLISVIVPVYNVDEEWLRRALDSVLRQLYSNWELCVADDSSSRPHVRRVIEEYAKRDSRIKTVFRLENEGIAAASNSALELATGEFVALLDHDDEIPEHALYMVAEELNAHPDATLIYSDEDKLSEKGTRYDPHFKPDWNPDLFYSYNLITHLAVYRRSVIEKIGGFRGEYRGSQDYDLALRIVEEIPADQIRHIPHILYHWRAIPGSVALGAQEKEYAHENAREAIRAHLKRRGVNATVTAGAAHCHRVIYPLRDPAPLVSVIIGTRDRVDLLRNAVEGVLEETAYEPLEIVIIDNQSCETSTLEFLREVQHDPRVRVISYDAPFNFSAINNLGARRARGEILCLMNNDIRVMSSDWLREMVSHAMRLEIGAVGAKLYYPNDLIQHAGVVLGIQGVAGHSHKHFGRDSVGYATRTQVIQNYSAVTAACMVLRRKVFDELGGLDETNLPIAFNDIDLCLRIRKRGYRILWTPYAELYHDESASRGPDDVPAQLPRFLREQTYMKLKWGELLVSDPSYNPNLTLDAEDFSFAAPPRAARIWKE
jgi:GT2 family glycosyltransferase